MVTGPMNWISAQRPGVRRHAERLVEHQRRRVQAWLKEERVARRCGIDDALDIGAHDHARGRAEGVERKKPAQR